MRLIDADELIEHAWRDKLDSRELIAEMIENAPTIKEIPTKIPLDVFERLVLKQSEWIPVDRMLPKMGDFVICSVAKNKGRHRIIISEYNGASYWHDGIIEAWMLLPTPYEP